MARKDEVTIAGAATRAQRERLAAAGGRAVTVLLTPAAWAVVRAQRAEGKSMSAAVSRLVVAAGSADPLA